MDFIIKFMLGWAVARVLLFVVAVIIAVVESIRMKNKYK